jgi:hypothetical protein
MAYPFVTPPTSSRLMGSRDAGPTVIQPNYAPAVSPMLAGSYVGQAILNH